MAYWESPDMRQSDWKAQVAASVPARRRLTKEEERRILRIAKSRARARCGALITNMDVDKCPPPMQKIHAMPKSHSTPALDTRSHSSRRRDMKKKQEEKDTIHTLRLAKWRPRAPYGGLITIP